MPPLKVVHVTTVDLSLRYLVLPQLQAVVDRGWTAIGVSAPGPHVPALNAAGVEHRPLPASTRSMAPIADLRAAAQLWKILRQERPDVVHTHTPKPGFYGRILARLAGVPAVVNTTHGLYATPDDVWAKRWIVYAVEAVASRFSHAELVHNPEDLDLMVRRHLVARRKARVLGGGVDIQHFDAAARPDGERLAVRSAFGFAPDDIVVGIVARLVAEKGIPELIEAVAALGPPFRLLVVGERDEAKADAVPARLIADAEAGGAVFAGHRDDIERCYSAMDVFALPSHREGFPRAAMEAAAMGLPIIATDTRGCRQIVDDGANGWLVPVRDPAALAAAIGRLRDEGARRSMGVASRRKAEAEFDERRIVAIVLDTYARVLGRPESS